MSPTPLPQTKFISVKYMSEFSLQYNYIPLSPPYPQQKKHHHLHGNMHSCRKHWFTEKLHVYACACVNAHTLTLLHLNTANQPKESQSVQHANYLLTLLFWDMLTFLWSWHTQTKVHHFPAPLHKVSFFFLGGLIHLKKVPLQCSLNHTTVGLLHTHFKISCKGFYLVCQSDAGFAFCFSRTQMSACPWNRLIKLPCVKLRHPFSKTRKKTRQTG